MPRQVTYTEIARKYRPYLEVIFFNSLNLTRSSKAFGLIDSGADHIVIPYSMGQELGLQPPTATELASPVTMVGVGGEAWYVERQCQIEVLDNLKNEAKVFREQVSWIHPDPSTQAKRNSLAKEFEKLNSLLLGTKSIEEKKQIQEQLKIIEKEIGNINQLLEVDTLLGRSFFDNFKRITFFHHDRNREHECYFEYEINDEKVLSTHPITTIHA